MNHVCVEPEAPLSVDVASNRHFELPKFKRFLRSEIPRAGRSERDDTGLPVVFDPKVDEWGQNLGGINQ